MDHRIIGDYQKDLDIRSRLEDAIPSEIPASSRSGMTMKYEASKAKRVRKL